MMSIENLTSFINKSYQFAIYNFEFLELIITNLVEESCMPPESIPKFHCQSSYEVILMLYFYMYAFIASCICIYNSLCKVDTILLQLFKHYTSYNIHVICNIFFVQN